MADEQNEVRRINWGETFAFTHIFRSFKMAIHPSKLLLALAAILLICGAGVVMDQVWSWGGQRVRDGEIMDHAGMTGTAFEEKQDKWEDEDRLKAAAKLKAAAVKEAFDLSAFLQEVPPGLRKFFREEINKQNEKNKDDKYKPDDVNPDKIAAQAREKDTSWSSLVDDAEDAHEDRMERIHDMWDDCVDKAEEELDKAEVGENKPFKTEDEKEKAQDELSKVIDRLPRILTRMQVKFEQDKARVEGQRVFAGLLQWESTCLRNAIMAVRYGNFTGGMSLYRARLRGRDIPSQDDLGIAVPVPQQAGPEPVPANQRCGMLYWSLMAVQGLRWFIQEHWLYAAIFLVFALAVWSLFGGAIHRIAALQAARDEKISMGQALKFSMDKFLSFFSAPLIPLVLLLVVGLFLFVGGLLGNIPWVGPILMGAVFFLALIGGIVMAFLAIALIGGVGLMYPTIAVEGSDSFDAISRSISYIFQRPWHALLYGVVTAIYGVLTYLFVRFFTFVVLALTHCFVKMGVFIGGHRLDPAADNFDAIWAAPTFETLLRSNPAAMTNAGQAIGSWLIWIWVGLLVGLMIAYLPSFLASSTTVIYYLLRRKVDATDLDDVYVEEPEEEEEVPAGPIEEEGTAPEEGKPAEEEPPAAEEDKPAEEEPAEEEKPAEEEEKPAEEEEKAEDEEEKSE